MILNVPLYAVCSFSQFIAKMNNPLGNHCSQLTSVIISLGYILRNDITSVYILNIFNNYCQNLQQEPI